MVETFESVVKKPTFYIKIVALLLCSIGITLVVFDEKNLVEQNPLSKILQVFGSSDLLVDYFVTKIAFGLGLAACLAGLGLYFFLDDYEIPAAGLSGVAAVGGIASGVYLFISNYNPHIHAGMSFIFDGGCMSIAALSVCVGLTLLADALLNAFEKL